jgi:hypothetical protein
LLVVVSRTALGEAATRVADDAAHVLDVVVGELVFLLALDGDDPPA